MQLTRLEINGFRGLYKDFDLSGDTIVTAGNGKGKTTILCALLWLLCGVDDEDKLNYNLFDNKLPQGDPTRPLQMSVTGYFDTITIQRAARQKYGKDGQRKGDEYAYYVNDVEVSATRFAELIEQNFMPNAALKLSLNIRRWELLGEQALRDQICRLAADDTRPTDAKYDVVRWAISESGVDGAKKHFAKRRKEFDEAAKKLAIECAAAKSRCPETRDVSGLEARLRQAEKDLADVDGRIHAAIPADILQKRGDQERAIYEKQAAYKQAEIEYNANAKIEIAQAKSAWEHAKMATDRNNTRRGQLKDANRCLADAELDRQRLLDELSQCRKRVFTGLCPTCGQQLQGESRTEKMAAFKSQKESDELRIITDGRIIAERIETLKGEIERIQAEILAEKEIDTLGLERTYRLLENRYAKVSFADTDTAQRMRDEIAELEQSRTPMPDMTASETDKERRGELLTEIERLRGEIAVAVNDNATAERIRAEIDNLENRRQSALRKMAEFETSLNLAKEYETEWARLLQDGVNSQFSKIRIRLSDVTKGGDIVDCCKVEMSSVADTLNTASRVVAGIEISLAFQRRFGVSLPMIVDNAESVERSRIDADGRQVVLMYMKEGEELNVKKA